MGPMHESTGLDFHPFGPSEPPTAESALPNPASMGVVTLAPGGAFVSSRQLTPAELAQAWREHDERHGKAARMPQDGGHG